MGNASRKGANKHSEQRQTNEQREEWDKWLAAEKAEWQKERENQEKEWQMERGEKKTELKPKSDSEEMKKKEIELKRLRGEVINLKPGDSVEFPEGNITFPKKLNVGLFGTTGIGKSSLINSLKFALKGELTDLMREQTSTAHFHGGNTVRRLPVGITRYLTFIDNRGVGAEYLENIDAAAELISQLEGRSYFAEEIAWHKQSRSKKNPSDEDARIYCTVLVFDARNPQSVYTFIKKLVTEIFKWQGRYPIGVITHVDVATQDQLENMYVVLNSAGLVDTYEVANIICDNDNQATRKQLSLDHQLNLLRLMRRCIKEGDCIFTLRGQIERLEVQQAEEREREAEEERQKQAILEREREEARQAKEAEEARIAKDKEEAMQKEIYEELKKKEKEAEEVRQQQAILEREREEARQAEEAKYARIAKEKKEAIQKEIDEKFKLEFQKIKIFVSVLLAIFVVIIGIWSVRN